MGNTRERVGAASVAVAGVFFRMVLYVCVAVMIFWIGKSTYQFGFDVFNQQAMNPGNGQEITVVIQDGSSVYSIGKTLENKGLIKDAKAFWVQELFSNYHGKIRPGTYLLSTAYTPDLMMEIMSEEPAEQEGADNS